MYNRILVPLDGSKLAECVLEHVLEISKGCHVSEVILFRVCEPLSVLADYPSPAAAKETWEKHLEEVNNINNQQCSLYLNDVEDRLKKKGLAHVKVENRLGDPAEEIIDYAAKHDIDLIIMASHGRSGPSRWAYGSISDKVFRSTCVPVLMVRAPGCFVGV